MKHASWMAVTVAAVMAVLSLPAPALASSPGAKAPTPDLAVENPRGGVLPDLTGVKPGGPTTTIEYRGVAVDVPAQMSVIDLDAAPRTCVRFDRPVVYVGTPGADQDCPARAIGRTESVWIGPASAGDPTARRGPAGGAPGGLDRESETTVAGSDVAVRVSWREHPETAHAVSLSARANPAPGATPTSPEPTPSVPASPSPAPSVAPLPPAAPSETQSPALPGPAVPPAEDTALEAGPARTVAPAVARPAGAPVRATVDSTGRMLTGMAFDACAAPSVATMQAWRSSPYAAVGIYIGGSMRACGDGNLSAAWLDTVAAQGWGFIPIYVGLQSPCVYQGGLDLISRDLATARRQGAASATDAVAAAGRFGLTAGTPLYFDMEAYATGDAGCSQATVAFLDAWTSTLHAAGYQSGVYGGVSSMMRDLVRAIQAGSVNAPDAVWFAHWNDRQSVQDTLRPQIVPDSYWTDARMRQYGGGRDETWGGVTINIDPNWVETRVPGNPVQTDYGPSATGPGGAGFVMSGAMTYWRAAPGQGATGRAYWTQPSGTTAEENGASWTLRAPAGTYAVDAYVPSTVNAGVAPYTFVSGATVTTASLDQAAGSGYRRVGVVEVGSSGVVTVRLGDNSPSPASTVLWADALRLTRLGVPAPVPWARAVAGDGRATVTWGSPPPAPYAVITAYTITVEPGGRQLTAGPADSMTVVTGLANAQSYTFTVTAVASGMSSAGRVSNAVTPMVGAAPASHPRGDLDGDGRADVVARTGDGRLVEYAGDGSGNWLGQLVVGTGWGGMTALVAPGDFDGDGAVDVLARTSNGDLWLYRGNGAGGWRGSTRVGIGWGGMSALVGPGDFDGDGAVDVLARTPNGDLWLYRGDGAGGWRGSTRVGIGWGGMSALVAPGDFNGDGAVDVLARTVDGDLWLYRGNGAGGWRGSTRVGIGWGAMTALSGPGDFDGDGAADVVARTAGGDLWLYRGNGAGGWRGSTRIGIGWAGFTVLLP